MYEILDLLEIIYDWNEIISIVLSVLSSAVLFTTWCLLHKWRSVLKFIIINQVFVGTLESCFDYYIYKWRNDNDYKFIEIEDFLYWTSLCWSLCAMLCAYIRLVLVYNGKISYEKRKAFCFTYSSVFLIQGILYGIEKKYFRKTNELYVQLFCIKLICTCILSNTCIYIFIKVVLSVMSSCKRSISNVRVKRTIALVVVATLCDLLRVFYFSTHTIIMFLSLYRAKGCIEVDILFAIFKNILCYRSVFKAIFILMNRSSRELWKKQYRLWKNRALNIV